jgi:WD40 repeat protein
LSVTAACISLGETVLATGARDYKTVLWDLEEGKKTNMISIDRNMVTDMKWLPSDNNTFMQSSEDLRLRIFDIRDNLDVAKETVVGTNFAGSIDIDESGKYIVTGHKGFNNSG